MFIFPPPLMSVYVCMTLSGSLNLDINLYKRLLEPAELYTNTRIKRAVFLVNIKLSIKFINHDFKAEQ